MSSQDVAQAFADIGTVFGGGLDDPYPIYARHRREEPVMAGDFQAQYGVASQALDPKGVRPVYTLFKYEDIMTVLRDPETFTSGLMMEKLGSIVGNSFLPGLDGEEHRITRELLQRSFSPTSVMKWKKEMMDPLARDRYVLPLASRGRCNILTELAIPFPIHVIYRIIGFPEGAASFEYFAELGLRILASAQNDPVKALQAGEIAVKAADELNELVLPLIATRRRGGAEGNDLISKLLRAEVEGQTLDDASIASFIVMLIPGAAETTTRTFGVLMAMLLNDPALLDRLRQDRSLIPKAIDESQRIEPTNAFMARQTTKTVTLSGVEIPAGSALLLAQASGNRDENAFPDPERFDIFRPARRGLQFGYGIHVCLGIYTAKAEIEAMVGAILDCWPGLRADPDYPPPMLKGMHMRGPDHLQAVWTSTK